MTTTVARPSQMITPAPATKVRPMRIAYLTTEYPKVSHTFIRREIVELERRGHYVLRLAIRDSGGAIADEADRREAQQTVHCLSMAKWKLVLATLEAFVTRPVRWITTMRTTLAMHRRSDRGLLRHIAYLVEAAALLPILRQHQIEHVHVHFGTNSAAVARLIYLLGGPRYSITVHGPGEFDSPRGFSLGEKAVDSAFTVAISGYVAAQLRRWVPFEHWDKIHIVHCTVGEEFFRHAKPIDPQSRTLVCIGRLTPQKGQHLLIDAMRGLVDDGIKAKLVLAGDGEMRSEIESRIDRMNLREHIEITGWIDEAAVRRHLQRARALVLPSFAEGLPVVIMEAMAMGRPVISTIIAGIPELVRHGEHGWLFPSGDLDELVNAMRQALCTPVEQLNQMGDSAKCRVRERHHISGQVDRLERLFQAQCGGPTLRVGNHDAERRATSSHSEGGKH